ASLQPLLLMVMGPVTAPAGAVAVIWVLLLTVKEAVTLLENLTLLTPVKLLPEMVTLVPTAPLVGLMPLTVGQLLPPLTVKLPLTRVALGIPSLKTKPWNVRGVVAPAAPITLNFRLSSVPEPESALVPKAEMTSRPGVWLFGVIVMPLLNVPAVSKDGLLTCRTVWSNVRVRSYACTPSPVRLDTVIGIVTLLAGAPDACGSETVTACG